MLHTSGEQEAVRLLRDAGGLWNTAPTRLCTAALSWTCSQDSFLSPPRYLHLAALLSSSHLGASGIRSPSLPFLLSVTASGESAQAWWTLALCFRAAWDLLEQRHHEHRQCMFSPSLSLLHGFQNWNVHPWRSFLRDGQFWNCVPCRALYVRRLDTIMLFAA